MGNKNKIENIREKIINGLEEAYRTLIEYKKRKNSPVIISRNGEVIEVDPNEILPTTKYMKS